MAEKAAEMMKRLQEGQAELRERFPDLFANLSMATTAEYSCIATAMMRSEAAEQEGSICEDHLAGKICGEEGAALAKVLQHVPQYSGPEPEAYMSLRTYFADYTMTHRNASIHQIVFLGSGIDTRAYRLQELEGCHVIEVDGSKKIQEFKQRRIDELELRLLAKQRDVLVMNLADPSWPERLLALGFKPDEPTFWLVEGFLQYLTPEQNEVLFAAIEKLSAPQSELYCDVCGGDTMFKDALLSQESMRNGRFKSLPWTNDVIFSRTSALEYGGSLWDVEKFKDYTVTRQEDATYGQFYFAWLKKSAEENL